MVTFTLDKDRKVSISMFDAVLAPGGRTLRRTKRRISGSSVHAASEEVPPATPPPAPKAPSPPAVTGQAPVKTIPGWTAEDDQQLLEVHRIGVALAGKQGIKERYKQLTKDDIAKAKDTTEGTEEKAPAAETETEWTAEDDEKMAKMKKDKKSWKEIEAALGGKKGAKARYKEVSKDAGDDTDHEAEDKSKGSPKSNSLVMTEAELKKTPSFSGQTIKPVVRLEDGKELSLEEMIYLCRLQEFFEAQKWVNVASKFFDKTGKRIEATELRAKLSHLWTEPLPVR